MSLLSVCKEVAKVIALDVPDVVASSTDREIVELFSLANEMAERIAAGHEWQKLSSIHTLTGDGATTAFDLPTDYSRMLVKAQVWSSSLETALSPITDLDRWLELDVQDFDFVVNAWTIYGGQMHIKPALATGVTAKFFYQKNTIIQASGGTYQTEFLADEDTFTIDDRLLKLGMIWQWKANKGRAYAEDMENYESHLERLVVRDKGSKMIRIGSVRMPRDTRTAYPQAIEP